MKLDEEKLKIFIRLLAESMGLNPLPETRASQLIGHVLFQQDLDGISGKEGWSCCEKFVITERELRNLLLAHAAAKIYKYNQKSELNSASYLTKELCQNVELALFGKLVDPTKFDSLDPWERKGA